MRHEKVQRQNNIWREEKSIRLKAVTGWLTNLTGSHS